MNDLENCTVTAFENKWEIVGDGIAKNIPFDNMYYSPPGSEPITFGCLSFAGHNLAQSRLLSNAKFYCLEFTGEKLEEQDREAWANPLRGKVLHQLSDKNSSWYIAFVSDITERMILNDNRIVDEKIFRFFSEMDPARVEIVLSEKPYGAGYGFEKKLFFEILNREIEWVVQDIWKVAKEIYPIEGYNLPSGRMDIIKQWNQRNRDDRLFKEVLEKSLITFYTYPAEPRNFKFISDNMDYAEFTTRINLTSLQQEAVKIEMKQKT